MREITFYAPTFLDESMTYPDKKGNSRPTGKLNGLLFTRRFYKTPKGHIKSERGYKYFSWEKDNESSKVSALKKAIKGLREMPELKDNPPLDFIPPKKYLTKLN